MRWLGLFSTMCLLAGCSCDAIVAMDDDGGGVDAATTDAGPGGPDSGDDTDAGPDADGGGVDGGGVDAGDRADGGTGPDSGPECPDDDLDGVTTCDSDCDDADPLTYPGAPEVCGDGVDNDCGSDPDPGCGGIGTHVSVAGSDTTGDGTQANPVRTIAQGIANAVTIGGATTVVVGGGTYDETVDLVEGVSIQGGFDCPSLPCSWNHAPGSQESIVDGGSTANAMDADDTITRATRIEDLTLRSGRTAFQIIGGAPFVIRCRVDGAAGISAYGGSNPHIESCTVDTTGRGVAMEDIGELIDSDVEGAPAVSVRGASLVQHNVIHASGDTGIWNGGDARIDGNVINETASRVGTCSFGFCSGVAIWGGSPELTNNIVYGMGGAMSAAISIVHGELVVDEPIIHSNTLYGARNPGAAGSISAGVSCESFFGIAMFGELRNNIIIGASAGTSFGYYEADHATGVACRPVLMENNALFDIDHVARFSGTPETLFTTPANANAESWATANLMTDPMLDANHRLQAGSGCIDQGTTTEAPAFDRDGDARPTGSGFDIGADERP